MKSEEEIRLMEQVVEAAKPFQLEYKERMNPEFLAVNLVSWNDFRVLSHALSALEEFRGKRS